MAITRVQTKSGSRSGAGSTLSITLTSVPTDGDALVIVVAAPQGRSVSSISQTGATWQSANVENDTVSSEVSIWYALNVSGASTSITVTMSAANLLAVARVAEYSGIATSSALDVADAGANGVTSPFNNGAVSTTVQASELWITGMSINATGIGAYTPDTNWTNIGADSSGIRQVIFDEQIASTKGVPSDNSSSTDVLVGWASCVATFKAAIVVETQNSLYFAGD